MRSLSTLLLFTLLAPAPACSVPLEPVEESVVNACASSDDCGEGAACAALPGSGRACVATAASLGDVLLEVQPAPGSRFGSETALLLRPSENELLRVEGSDPSGIVVPFDRALPRMLDVVGRVALAEGYAPCEGGCCAPAPDRSIPAKVTFRRSRPYVGLSDVAFSAQASFEVEPGDPPAGSYVFSLGLIEGEGYAVYVEPTQETPPVEGCPGLPPPQILRLPARSEGANLSIVVDAPRALEVKFKDVPSAGVEGFELAVIDARTGLRVSDARVLGPPGEGGAPSPSAKLRYYRPEGDASPVLRLSPPGPAASAERPTLYWELDTVDFDGDGRTEIALGQLSKAAEHFEATVVAPGAEAGSGIASAKVVVQSAFVKDPSLLQNYSIRLSTQTDSRGAFRAALVPGTYKVVVTPPEGSGLAVTESEWEIAPGQFCCGKLFELREQAELEGEVELPSGEPYAGVEVVARGALSDVSSYIASVLRVDVAARDARASTGESGAFGMGLDPGLYDLSVRPASGSLFAWLVEPRFSVEPGVGNLGTRRVSYPAVVTGVLADPGGKPLASATVRAFLPIPFKAVRSGDLAVGSALPVGEAKTDASGRYVLALPPSVIPLAQSR